MLEVQRTVDPDQVLWDNIGFTIEEQQARAVIALLVQILTAVCSLFITLQIQKLQRAAGAEAACPERAVEREAAYAEQAS